MPDSSRPITVPRFRAAKARGEKLAMVTAYDHLWAGLFDSAGVDSILVGDSLGMVVQGKANTLPVTLDEIIYHAEMVVRGTQRALVVVDLPFMTYQVGTEQALVNAGRIIKETGAAAVKLEGGAHQAATIRALADSELPVMAHVGMKPQSVHHLGGMGRIQRDEAPILADAKAAEDAGAFAIVLELIPAVLAKKVTQAVSIPTIGIGAGPHCDGQVLVGPDLLGLTEGFHPRFLKHYANLAETVRDATQNYVREVHEGLFPTDEHSHE
jgi:3-methyl-2-oxobutanoate hydroxymethyltransferase